MYRIYDERAKQYLPGLWSTWYTADCIRMGRVRVLGEPLWNYSVQYTLIGCRW